MGACALNCRIRLSKDQPRRARFRMAGRAHAKLRSPLPETQFTHP